MKAKILFAVAIAIAFSVAAFAQSPPAPVYELACPAGYSPLQSMGKTLNSLTGQWRANFCISGKGDGKIICQATGCSTSPSGIVITTVAGLATVTGKTKGTIAAVTDGNSATDCTTGTGTTAVACQYSGTTWAAVSGGGAYTLPTATSSVLGGVKPDGTSILNTAGAISATAASVGALGLHAKADSAAAVDATPLPAPGTTISLSAPRGYAVCTSTCNVTLPTPAAGYEFCILNDDNVTTVITLVAITNVMWESTARTSYGTAGHTFTSAGAAADKICVVGRDATHYMTAAYNGTWTLTP